MIVSGDDRKKWFFLAAGTICLLLAFGLVATFQGRFTEDDASRAQVPDEFVSERDARVDRGGWVVYITGAVMHPGVYEVSPNSRINDALKAAGGFSVHADPEAINLAARIEDGAHIRVPERGAARLSGEGDRTRQAPVPSALPANPGAAGTPSSGKIDINRASEEELCRLPGIGPKLAAAIALHREQNGAFESPEDLCNVKGIGAKKFEAIRKFVVVTK